MKRLTTYGKICIISSVIFFAFGLTIFVYGLITGQFMSLTITLLGLGFVCAGNLYLFKDFSFRKTEGESD
ncbi:hypothetical protein [Halalkalibacter sp. APA_J-10(15)]|uniref:hypothetical protein n=1 Tax=Halalkalibacter sp. APA_J-10(15) TaxID=2933805 RepID=UPI001FF5D4F9|nr:hypothetical protein [Halalkalibacter sp. APA_J-10(15)]MCK0470415.1 hypothetical protein [Halalkalibacter sp. APA_J-10(15)]